MTESMTRIKIIYEDNHLLVVNKPPNMLSQADITKDEDLLTLLKSDLKIRYQKPGNVFLGLLHRLDRPVGGVMVFAKTSKAASRVSLQIRNKDFKKDYLAIVHGKPRKSACLRHFLLKDSKSNMVSIVNRNVRGAQEAILEYEMLAAKGNLSLVKVNLLTGRSHQIRVQLNAEGNPLFGDIKYGAAVNKVGQQIALFSHSISFSHPTLNETMTFTALPDDTCYPWNLFLDYLKEL